MRLKISSTLVDVVISGYMVELFLGDGTTIQAEAEVSLAGQGVDAAATDASLQYVTHGRVAQMVGTTVTGIIIDELSGSLTVRFADGSEATVSADPDFEAWTLSRRDGSKFVSLPGGGIARWQPET